MRDLSIYIHIPFCVRKCLYCDFLSFPVAVEGEEQVCGSLRNERKGQASSVSGMQAQEMQSYVNLLEQEIRSNAPKYKEYQVISIFWGGGTPSILPAEDVSHIMTVIRENYRIAADAEITIEMNPKTADARKMQQYITAGMNRISIGMQSADDRELVRIGRIHDHSAFLETYELARNAGFRNINIDIMAALPEQSVASYEKTLNCVTALQPEHISAYSLILEEGTPLYERQSEYHFPSEEEDREMYMLTKDYLAAFGYHRYEISNYAKDGYECRHNKVYWQRGDYVGFGLGASSMVRNVRWKNPEVPEAYESYIRAECGELDKQHKYTKKACLKVEIMQDMVSGAGEMDEGHILERQILTTQEQMEEHMFLGLRMMCGVDRQEFARTFGRRIEDMYGETIERLCRQELLIQSADRIRLTDRGIDVSNYVMSQFLFD